MGVVTRFTAEDAFSRTVAGARRGVWAGTKMSVLFGMVTAPTNVTDKGSRLVAFRSEMAQCVTASTLFEYRRIPSNDARGPGAEHTYAVLP